MITWVALLRLSPTKIAATLPVHYRSERCAGLMDTGCTNTDSLMFEHRSAWTSGWTLVGPGAERRRLLGE